MDPVVKKPAESIRNRSCHMCIIPHVYIYIYIQYRHIHMYIYIHSSKLIKNGAVRREAPEFWSLLEKMGFEFYQQPSGIVSLCNLYFEHMHTLVFYLCINNPPGQLNFGANAVTSEFPVRREVICLHGPPPRTPKCNSIFIKFR